MIIDEYGTVGYTQQEVMDYLKVNPNFDLDGLHITDGESYVKARNDLFLESIIPEISLWTNRQYDLSVQDYHRELQKIWLMPDEYSNMDIYGWFRTKAQSIEQLERVNEELRLYEKYGLIDLLRYLKYLRDTAEKNGIVWGVGRGSSCCSYCLFLLGVHRVDSIKYGLNIEEFLRG